VRFYFACGSLPRGVESRWWELGLKRRLYSYLYARDHMPAERTAVHRYVEKMGYTLNEVAADTLKCHEVNVQYFTALERQITEAGATYRPAAAQQAFF